MAVALFCSADYVKKHSIVGGSLDGDKLKQFIKIAQDTHIQNYLGTELYEKLEDLVVANEISDVGNEAYATLLNTYIKPMLAWYTQWEYFPFASYTLNNGGLFKRSPDNSETLTEGELNTLTQKAMDKAIFYTNRLLDYLCANSSSFAEYTQTTDGQYPDKDVNNFGWVL